MEDRTLGFIGAGNIARAIIGGLISHGFAAEKIHAADPSEEQRAHLPHGVKVAKDNLSFINSSDVVILCVKPNLVVPVAEEIGAASANKLIISVAAGVTTTSIAEALGVGAAIIRCMPNTPALVQTGMMGLFANSEVHDNDREVARSIMAAVGQTAWFDSESDLDAVTAISGSGPAYFFLVMEAMQQAAQNLGIDSEVARTLVLQTALGAARMAISSKDDVATLRRNVTSPNGTTEAAVNALIEAGLVSNFEDAINAAHKRSIELSKA